MWRKCSNGQTGARLGACRNIFAFFVHENSHQGQRPEKLTRRYPQHTLRSGQLRSKHATLVVC